jgi:hypothetical protein
MLDGIIENTFIFNKSLLVLKDVNVINKGFKERCFLLWNWHMLFLVFMFCKSLTMMVLLLNYVEMFFLLLDLGVWCDVSSYSLWHFVLEEG